MKNKNFRRIALAGLLGLASLGIYGNSTKGYETINNVKYKGFQRDEGLTKLVFDSVKPVNGNLEKLDLELYQNYDILIRIPRWFAKEVVKATPLD